MATRRRGTSQPPPSRIASDKHPKSAHLQTRLQKYTAGGDKLRAKSRIQQCQRKTALQASGDSTNVGAARSFEGAPLSQRPGWAPREARASGTNASVFATKKVSAISGTTKFGGPEFRDAPHSAGTGAGRRSLQRSACSEPTGRPRPQPSRLTTRRTRREPNPHQQRA